jgi:hypothetical protein
MWSVCVWFCVATSGCANVYRPLELDVDDAGVAELVVAAGLGHGAERGATEVKVVLGDRVVVHVSDDHRLRIAGARIVVDTSYLEKGQQQMNRRNCLSVHLHFRFHEGRRQHKRVALEIVSLTK